VPAVAAAQVAPVLHYQGVMSDLSDAPITRSLPMSFRAILEAMKLPADPPDLAPARDPPRLDTLFDDVADDEPVEGLCRAMEDEDDLYCSGDGLVLPPSIRAEVLEIEDQCAD
jgi:hypothetical protein